MGRFFDVVGRARNQGAKGADVKAGRLIRFACSSVLSLSLLAPGITSAAPLENPSANEILPIEVGEYKEDFDVSASTAERNLDLQHEAAGIVTALSTAQGEDFAGVWFDNQAGEFVVGMAPDAKLTPILDVLEGMSLKGDARIEGVRATWKELMKGQEVLDGQLENLLKQGLLMTSLDLRSNAVELLVASDATLVQRQQVERVSAALSTPTVVRATQAARHRLDNMSCSFTFKFCSHPLRGGVGITKGPGWGPECTAGFKAIGKQFGNRFMLTAGHCVVGIKKWWAELPSGEKLEIGSAEGTVYPNGDWTALNANGSEWDKGSWPSLVAFWGKGEAAQETPITAESSTYIGQFVCHAGFTTGGQCGPVVLMNVTAETGGQLKYHQVLYGPTCIDNGDSGGPVFAGNVALGLVSGGAGACGQAYGAYAEITEATDSLQVSVGPRLGTVPFGESEEATNISATGATLTAVINSHGIETYFHFQYGTTSAYGNTTPTWSAGSGWQVNSVSGPVSSLEPLMTYHHRLVAQNAAGTVYGTDEEFTTLSAPPIVVTELATGVGQREVTLRGSVNPRGASTSYQFEYGPTTGYGTSVPIPSEDVGSGRNSASTSQLVKGLQPGETYHYRIKATNSFGQSSFGADQQFTMKPAPPDVITMPATDVTETAATIKGSVNPNGLETTYYFEYGPTTAYGSQTAAINMGTGTKFVDKSEMLDALAQSVHVFHYRIRASNSLGTTFGSDSTFHPGWKAQPLATPESFKASQMASVSCASAVACTAIGHNTPNEGATLPRVERWNGTAWVSQATPGVEGASKGTLFKGVSCPTTTACTAVGFYATSSNVPISLAEHWNGSNWEIKATPAPAGAKETLLESVSCTSSTNCMAVGYQVNSYSLPHALRWDGTSWSLTTVPAPENSVVSWLTGVSCVSTTSCTAVGVYLDELLIWKTLVVRWDGTKWAIMSSPNPEESADTSTLTSISCTSSTACTAVGSYVTKKEAWTPLAMRWNGTAWSLQSTPPTPNPDKDAELLGVSCTSATMCLATGFFKDNVGAKVGLAERWDGSSWEAIPTPNPQGAKATTLRGISCAVSSDCQVAGEWENTSGNTNAVIESYRRTTVPTAATKAASNIAHDSATLNGSANPNGFSTSYFFEYGLTTAYGSKTAEVAMGSGGSPVVASSSIAGLEAGKTYHFRLGAKSSAGTSFGVDQVFTTPNPTWALQTVQTPEGATKGISLQGVSCSAESTCTAVGFSRNSSNLATMMAQRWNGSKWELQSLPSPSGAKESFLTSVSCPSAMNCIAAGRYVNSSSTSLPMALTWNGTQWELMSVPEPENTITAELQGISCTSATSCVAVGSVFDFSFALKSLAIHWNGTKWEILSTPSPAGSIASHLWGVSCTSATACTAVGTYQKSSGSLASHAIRWNGTSWTLQSVPAVEGEKESELHGVSCVSGTVCTATGNVRNGSGIKVTLIERWNGSAWTVQSSPNPSGAKESSLWGVSCPSTTACAAVGFFRNSAGTIVTLAERWNGTSWSVHTTPNPEGAKSSTLNTPFCSTATVCEAVGSYESSAGAKLPLAMGMK